MADFGIVIHGGAGVILKEEMTAEREKAVLDTLAVSIMTGYAVLEAGGSGLDAVQDAVRIMEDSPLFNAGKGAVFTYAGKHELDAAIMDGGTLRAGAVAGVRHIKNPIDLARLVMERSPHVILTGEGAEEFAQAQGMNLMPEEYFFTQHRWEQFQAAKGKEAGKEGSGGRSTHGTVGAVALDLSGNLAAATSTGGMCCTRYGRIGDSPIIGAGTYADNRSCAVSTTGQGEFFIRAVTAHDVSRMTEYSGISLSEAAQIAIHGRLAELGGSGGLIAIDRRGSTAMPFNTPGMYRGYRLQGGRLVTAIYNE